MPAIDSVLRHDNPVIRLLRALFGLASLFTFVANIFLQLQRSGSIDLGNYLSYFTIQSNIIVAVVLVIGAARPRASLPAWWDDLRGAAALYIAVTGIVYALLLSKLAAELGTTAPWVDWVLHDLTPIAGVVDWLLIRPEGRVRALRALWWLAYPVAYLLYTLARGPLVDWYPYPFIDPRLAGGYGRLVGSTGVVVIVFVVLAIAIDLLGRARARIGAPLQPESDTDGASGSRAG